MVVCLYIRERNSTWKTHILLVDITQSTTTTMAVAVAAQAHCKAKGTWPIHIVTTVLPPWTARRTSSSVLFGFKAKLRTLFYLNYRTRARMDHPTFVLYDCYCFEHFESVIHSQLKAILQRDIIIQFSSVALPCFFFRLKKRWQIKMIVIVCSKSSPPSFSFSFRLFPSAVTVIFVLVADSFDNASIDRCFISPPALFDIMPVDFLPHLHTSPLRGWN